MILRYSISLFRYLNLLISDQFYLKKIPSNGSIDPNNKKIALISYIKLKKSNHSNYFDLQNLVQYLLSHNYTIVLVTFRNIICLLRNYDLIIGFGVGYNFGKAKRKILFHTEGPTSLAKNIYSQIKFLSLENHFTKIRNSKIFNEKLELKASEIIIFGNDKKRWVSITKAQLHCYFPSLSKYSYKLSYSVIKNEFLYILSDGIVHKGIHHLDSIAKNFPHCKFYLIGMKHPEFYDFKSFNIINLGFIDLEDSKYSQLLSTVNLVLSFSVSEAAPTGVLNLWKLGIPAVVSYNSGILKNSLYGVNVISDLSELFTLVQQFLGMDDVSRNLISTKILNFYENVYKSEFKFLN